jgi:hypothetical protein
LKLYPIRLKKASEDVDEDRTHLNVLSYRNQSSTDVADDDKTLPERQRYQAHDLIEPQHFEFDQYDLIRGDGTCPPFTDIHREQEISSGILHTEIGNRVYLQKERDEGYEIVNQTYPKRLSSLSTKLPHNFSLKSSVVRQAPIRDICSSEDRSNVSLHQKPLETSQHAHLSSQESSKNRRLSPAGDDRVT